MPLSLSMKNKLKRFNDFYPTSLFQLYGYNRFISDGCLFGEVRIPFIVGKIQNKIILWRMLHLSYILSSAKFCEALTQNRICSNG